MPVDFLQKQDAGRLVRFRRRAVAVQGGSQRLKITTQS
jgi:hypothetical protein